MLHTHITQLLKSLPVQVDKYLERLCSHPRIDHLTEDADHNWSEDYCTKIPIALIDNPVRGMCGTLTTVIDGIDVAVDVKFADQDVIMFRVGDLQIRVSVYAPPQDVPPLTDKGEQ
jgi:hypothetical protein